MCVRLTGNEQAKAIYKKFGQDLAVSGVHLGSLALGVEPVKALGYTFFALLLLQLESFISMSYADFGMSRGSFIGYTTLLAAFSTRFLLLK